MKMTAGDLRDRCVDPRRRPVRGSEFKLAIPTGKRHEFIRVFALNFPLWSVRACIRVALRQLGICNIAVSPVEAMA
jgi:hypothetical protein